MITRLDSEIVAEFLGYHHMALDSDDVLRRQGESWALDAIFDLAYDDPERCWRLMRAIAQESPNQEAMMSLGVKLGFLLLEHPEIINVISRDVCGNPQLVGLLTWVEEDENFAPVLWEQIVALSK